MSHKLHVFTNRICPFCQRVEIVAAEKNINLQRTTIPLGGAPMPDWYKALNPRETVPTLQIDDQKLVYESLFIATYLDKISNPSGALMGQTPQQRYNIEFFIGQISFLINAAYDYLRHPTDEGRRKELDANAAYINDIVASAQTTGPFLCDDMFSMAEVAVVPFLDRFRATLSYGCFYDIFDKAPLLKKLWAASRARHSVSSTSLPPAEYIKGYQNYLPNDAPMKGANGNYVLLGVGLSQYTDTVAIACAAKNIAPYRVEVNLVQPPAWFLHANPRGTVPVLVTPDGTIIQESKTIVRFLDHASKDGPSLTYSSDAEKEYAVNYFTQCAEEFVSAMYSFVMHPDSDDAKKGLLWSAKQLVTQLRETPFGAGGFHGGAHMHAGDIALLPHLLRLKCYTPTLTNGFDLFAEFPALGTFLEHGLRAKEAQGVFKTADAYLGLMKAIMGKR